MAAETALYYAASLWLRLQLAGGNAQRRVLYITARKSAADFYLISRVADTAVTLGWLSVPLFQH